MTSSPSPSPRPVGAEPRISAIVPSFNSGTFLRTALLSVLEQVPPVHQLVVQDGGSTDETLAILASLGDRVAWVSAPDTGQSDALNKALARVTGDVVLWFNADDVLLPGAVAAATAAFAADPGLAFAFGDFDMIDEAGGLIRSYQSGPYSWHKVFGGGCYIFTGSLFIRRQILEAIGGFDTSLHACMDFDLLLRIGDAGRSAHLGRSIGQLRRHDAAKSSTIGLIFLREGFRIRRRYAHRSPRPWRIAIRAAAMSAILLATAPLRYSRRWPRHRRGKTL